MKRIIFILCCFFALSTVAAASEFYDCVDKDGNKFITDNPPEDAKCKAREAEEQSSSGSSASSQPAGQSQDGGATAQQKGEIDRLKKMPRQSYE
jgi:hypothetical protein